jgi:hypothetical protein
MHELQLSSPNRIISYLAMEEIIKGWTCACPVIQKRIKESQDGVAANKRRKKLCQCSVCLRFGPSGLNCVTESGNTELCKKFCTDGTPKCQRCLQFRRKNQTLVELGYESSQLLTK